MRIRRDGPRLSRIESAARSPALIYFQSGRRGLSKATRCITNKCLDAQNLNDRLCCVIHHRVSSIYVSQYIQACLHVFKFVRAWFGHHPDNTIASEC